MGKKQKTRERLVNVFKSIKECHILLSDWNGLRLIWPRTVGYFLGPNEK